MIHGVQEASRELSDAEIALTATTMLASAIYEIEYAEKGLKWTPLAPKKQ